MELKAMYEELNFTNVLTYIQSGNVIFKNNSSADLSKQIEKKIYGKYNFEVPVLIRTAEEMQNIVNENPFLKEKDFDSSKLYVVFLSENPKKENIDAIKKYNFEPDTFYISGKEVYVYCPLSYGKTKLTNNFFENKLDVTATTRNWRTTTELSQILKSY